MAQTDLVIKVGDTLIADCTYKDAAGVPVDLDAGGITVTSAVLFPDNKRQELTVVVKDQALFPGEYRITGDTSDWRANAIVKWDVRYSRGGISVSTKTVTIYTQQRVA